MRWILSLCTLWIFMAAAPAHAQAPAKRVALVIGESNYRAISPLANPSADANLVARALSRAGFDVRLGLDLDKAALVGAIEDFARVAQQADVATVYYAGHGLESGGRNWLVPIDAQITQAGDMAGAAVPFEAITRSLAGAKVKIVALDACRDNPFAARVAEGGTINRGLAEVEVDGYVVMYAAGVGAFALDGQTNSPFATSFARWVSEPNIDLRLIAGRIRDDVAATTNGRQRPFISASLSGAETVLAPAAPGRIHGAATAGQGPSVFFDYVRTVKDENCFQTTEVKCETKGFTLRAGRLITFEDDNKARVWSADGATLQRTIAPPSYDRRDYADAAGALVFSGDVEERIGVHTPVDLFSITNGRRTTGDVNHASTEPHLELVTGAPSVAVFSYGECHLDFYDLQTFRMTGDAYWAIPLHCGAGKVHWIFADSANQRVIAGVTNTRSGAPNAETLLMSARDGKFICRIPGAAADAAFNETGGFHIPAANGAIAAYNAQCTLVRTDRLHRAEVTAIYPFGANRLLSRSIDGVMKVWAASSGAVAFELTGLPRRATIQGVAKNASVALILNEDRRLYLWTGEPRLGAYVGPSAPVCGGSLSPDANMVYAQRCDGQLEVWRRRAR
ncbi:MAG: caspase family protein [Alphaproteobacteria bacterium]|nr:caspase family protein [Alphaproteobacteria bacterium]